MKKRNRTIVTVLLAALILSVLTGCGSKMPAGSYGTYELEWESISIIEKTDQDFKFILDGKGGGEYHHKGSVHKVKYTYDESGNIRIDDTITGIRYNGTLLNGELHIYDGNPDSDTVSEFLYKKVYNY